MQYLTNIALYAMVIVKGCDWFMKEKKSENFKRLAENRTNKIIDMMNLLGNLSNKSNYSYSEEQVNMIFNTLEEELKKQKAKFIKEAKPKKKKFRL